MWRRLVFSLLASNYGDHLRNRVFLMLEPGRWSYSPAYDINPVPEMDRVRIAKTAITEDRKVPTIAIAPRFGLKPSEAKKILREIFTLLSRWQKPGDNSVSKHPPWTATLRLSSIRSWMKPED